MKPGTSSSSSSSSSAAVRATADDAVTAKFAASALGYLADPFSAKLAGKAAAPLGAPPKRVPMLNRGTWARVGAVDRVVDEFLGTAFPARRDGGEPVRRQIISLGAGLDSRFFRLKERSIRAQRDGHEARGLSGGLSNDAPVGAPAAAPPPSAHAAPPPLVVNGKVIDTTRPRFAGGVPRGDGTPGLPPAAPWRSGDVAYFEVDFSDTVARKREAILGSRMLHELAGPECCARAGPGDSQRGQVGAGESASLRAPTGMASFAEEEEEEEEESCAAGEQPVDGAEESAPPEPPAPASALTQSAASATTFSFYRLVEADLCDCAAVDSALRTAGMDSSAPTLLIAECAFVYMPAQRSASLVEWAARTFGAGNGEALLALYEMIHPHDAFGQVMTRNLRIRGCELHGMLAFPDLAAQNRRCSDGHWSVVTSGDMLMAYERFVDQRERRRIERIELLDEMEEWQLIMQHYCVVIAAVGEVSCALVSGAMRSSLESHSY